MSGAAAVHCKGIFFEIELFPTTRAGDTIESPRSDAQIYLGPLLSIFMKLTSFIGVSMYFYNLENFLKKIHTVQS